MSLIGCMSVLFDMSGAFMHVQITDERDCTDWVASLDDSLSGNPAAPASGIGGSFTYEDLNYQVGCRARRCMRCWVLHIGFAANQHWWPYCPPFWTYVQRVLVLKSTPLVTLKHVQTSCRSSAVAARRHATCSS